MQTRLQPVYSHLAIGLFVLGISVALVAGALALPADRGYTIMGSRVFPLIVAALVGTVGAGLSWQALTGGLRLFAGSEGRVDEAFGQRAKAALWVSGGLLIDALLIDRIGFVFASTVLFAAAARGFGSTRWPMNFAIGLALSWPIYVGFTLGLGLSLPGLFKPWI